MAVLRTIIADDEPLALELMKAKLKKFNSIELVAECKNGQEAIDAIHREEPDLVFLDIQMPKRNGLEVIQEVQSELTPIVVFATAHEEFAIEAFKVNAVDYILKPFDTEQLERAISRAELRFSQQDNSTAKSQVIGAIESMRQLRNDAQHGTVATLEKDKITIKDGERITILNLQDIKWVDAAGDYCCIHANGETYIKRTTLTELLAQLDSPEFQRVHRSTIINLSYITEVKSLPKGEYFVTLGDQEQVKVSRTYKNAVRDYLKL